MLTLLMKLKTEFPLQTLGWHFKDWPPVSSTSNRSDAHPTGEITIKFKIWSKHVFFLSLSFSYIHVITMKFCYSSLHSCKILLQSDHSSSNYSNDNFVNLLIWSKDHEWDMHQIDYLTYNNVQHPQAVFLLMGNGIKTNLKMFLSEYCCFASWVFGFGLFLGWFSITV